MLRLNDMSSYPSSRIRAARATPRRLRLRKQGVVGAVNTSGGPNVVGRGRQPWS